MADSKIFKLIDGIDTDLIAHGIEGFLRDKKNLTTESLKTPEGWLIQAKQTESWKKFLISLNDLSRPEGKVRLSPWAHPRH